MKSNIFMFCSLLCFWCLRIHCQIWCHEDLPIYFLLNSFIVLALILKILVYFGWIIIYGVRQGVQHDSLSISLSYCPSTVCAERILFPNWIILTLFSKINWPKILAAAAAKSLQSCPTLCDPIDGSPPGCPVPGTLQARTLEWVAISFSNAWKWKAKEKSLSPVQLFATHGQQPTRLLRPWDFPGKSTGVGCHCLLQKQLGFLLNP